MLSRPIDRHLTAQHAASSPEFTPVRGVFAADPTAPAPMPTGAATMELVDKHGVVIAAGWVHPDHIQNPAVLESAWELLERLDDPEAPSAAPFRPQIVR